MELEAFGGGFAASCIPWAYCFTANVTWAQPDTTPKERVDSPARSPNLTRSIKNNATLGQDPDSAAGYKSFGKLPALEEMGLWVKNATPALRARRNYGPLVLSRKPNAVVSALGGPLRQKAT